MGLLKLVFVFISLQSKTLKFPPAVCCLLFFLFVKASCLDFFFPFTFFGLQWCGENSSTFGISLKEHQVWLPVIRERSMLTLYEWTSFNLFLSFNPSKWKQMEPGDGVALGTRASLEATAPSCSASLTIPFQRKGHRVTVTAWQVGRFQGLPGDCLACPHWICQSLLKGFCSISSVQACFKWSAFLLHSFKSCLNH